MREKLINAIYDMARDEFETADDVFQLALKTDEQLLDDLIHLTEFFRDREWNYKTNKQRSLMDINVSWPGITNWLVR